jgi:hypothetical protein
MSAHRNFSSSSPIMDDLDEWTDTRLTRTEPRTNGSGGRTTRMETPMSSETQSQRMSSSGLRSQPRVDHLPPTSRMSSTSSDTKAKSSSRRSGKKLVPVLSPEGRLSIETLQKQEAELLRLRTMSRIGELYMVQAHHTFQLDMDEEQHGDGEDSPKDSHSDYGSEENSNETQEQKDKDSDVSGEDFFKVELKDSQPEPDFYSGFNTGGLDGFRALDPRVQYEGSMRDQYVHPVSRANPPLVSQRPSFVLGEDSPHPPMQGVMRNGAVTAVPSTVLRKNITQRRSHGRPRDRVSLGETSVPVDNLISKKPKPRQKDVAYTSAVVRENATPTKTTTPPPLSHDVDESAFPDFTRKYIPSDSPNPALVREGMPATYWIMIV